MEHHLIHLPLRSGDDRRESGFLKAIVRVKSVHGLGRVADDDQHFWFVRIHKFPHAEWENAVT
jgi:hypothetical protein